MKKLSRKVVSALLVAAIFCMATISAAAVEEGNMLISVFQDAAGQGSKAVEVVIDAIDKKPVEKDYWIDFEEVNKENVAEFKQRAQQ